jgi:hypothetical protein
MISVMMLVVVTTVFAKVVVGMLNDHRHVPPSHFAVASMRASPLLRGPLAYLLRNRLLLEARDRGDIFCDVSRFLATETVLSRVSGGTAAEY